MAVCPVASRRSVHLLCPYSDGGLFYFHATRRPLTAGRRWMGVRIFMYFSFSEPSAVGPKVGVFQFGFTTPMIRGHGAAGGKLSSHRHAATSTMMVSFTGCYYRIDCRD